MQAAALLAMVACRGCTSQPSVGLPPHVPSGGDYIILPRPAVFDSPPPARIEPADAKWLAQGYRPWRYIVVHHSATAGGNAQVFDEFHRLKRGWDELGYHFVITNGNGGPDGLVEVGSRWNVQKWGAHTGGTPDNEYNEYGIGICLVGDFTDSLPSQAQMESLRRLLEYLSARYGIPARNIIGHRDAPGAKTQCPGEAFWRHMQANSLVPS
ncbi:MAG: N-acetylmuramoyl-L-alanine amidase [Planctomycetes bacterium]|jgi:N-acetylmuramoyl-L-alanine amidase|nr:N-acetylmuramoyl-L-alanine amidase [Planctomycetota bacterium]